MTAPPQAVGMLAPGCPTEEARRAARDRRAWHTGGASGVAKLVNVAVRLITVPLALELLGTERYGLWLTVGSVLVWLSMYDVGLSTGLINDVAEAYGKDDRAAIREYASTAIVSFGALALLTALTVLAASALLPVPRLLGVSSASPLVGDAHALFLVCGLVFAAAVGLNSVNHLAAAMQEGYRTSYAAIGALLASGALLAVLSLRGATLIEFALAMALPQMLATLALGGFLFLGPYRWLRPSVRLCSLTRLGHLLRTGGPIFITQIADLAIVHSINLIIATRIGAVAVPSYAVPACAFGLVANFCYGISSAHMPAYSEARARSDWIWIRRSAFRTLGIVMAFIGGVSACMIAFGRFAVTLWTRGHVSPDLSLLVALSLYMGLLVWTNANGILLIGLGCARVKAVLQGVIALVFVSLAWLLLPRIGVIAIPVAGCCAYLIDALVSFPYSLNKIRNLTNEYRCGESAFRGIAAAPPCPAVGAHLPAGGSGVPPLMG